MSAAVLNAVLVADSPAPGDAELVERFVVARDQAAFAELVHRHSAVVLGVCRRILHDSHDIDDVFQATFLVLVKDAARVRRRHSLASWLYGVAFRLSLRVARQKQRRRETSFVEETLPRDDTFEKLTDRHDQQVVDIELNALPERYRQPLVLRYLSDHSTSEIANELGITVGAVEGLLKRGKDELRRRLLQRGITLGVALTALHVTQQAAESAATPALIESTIQAGLAWQTESYPLSSDLVSDQAVKLAAKEFIAMTTTSKAALAIGLTLGGLAVGLSGASAISGRPGGTAEAAGIMTTMSVAKPAVEVVELATLASDPNPLALATNEGGAEGSTLEIELELGMKSPKPKITKRPSIDWDYKSRSENVIKIENSLLDTSEVAFTDQTLKDALDYLEDLHHIEIVIDAQALQDELTSADERISLVLSGVTLKSVLGLMLDPLKLDYVIQNEVMLITSRSKSDETFETRVYKTGHLKGLSTDRLIELIKGMSGDAKWVESNAEGGAISGVGEVLVIRQTRRIHDEIIDLLNQLKEQQAANAAKTAKP